MAHRVMKMCTSVVSSLNPDRVVVLLVEGQGNCQKQQESQHQSHDCQRHLQDLRRCQGHDEGHGIDQVQQKCRCDDQSPGKCKYQGQVPEYLLSVVGEDQVVRLSDLETELSGLHRQKIQHLVSG